MKKTNILKLYDGKTLYNVFREDENYVYLIKLHGRIHKDNIKEVDEKGIGILKDRDILDLLEYRSDSGDKPCEFVD